MRFENHGFKRTGTWRALLPPASDRDAGPSTVDWQHRRCDDAQPWGRHMNADATDIIDPPIEIDLRDNPLTPLFRPHGLPMESDGVSGIADATSKAMHSR